MAYYYIFRFVIMYVASGYFDSIIENGKPEYSMHV